MGLAASHASMAAPMQGLTEISLGVLLVLGLFNRPVALVAFGLLTSLWVSEWGTSWIWELLVPDAGALGLLVGRAGRTWGIDAILARRNPILDLVVDAARSKSQAARHGGDSHAQ